MVLTVNGNEKSIAHGSSLSNLLKTLGLAENPCAVEVNGKVVPKREHAQCTLGEGDVIEIVTLVGGG